MSQGKWKAKLDFKTFYDLRAEKLRAFRVHSGYSRNYLGKLVNVSAESIRSWEEGGAIRRSNLEALEKIGIPKSWLYGGTQPSVVIPRGKRVRKANVKSRKQPKGGENTSNS